MPLPSFPRPYQTGGGSRERYYRVLGILGKGGMGEVLRVFDQKFERTLAMKVIHSALVHSPLIQQLFIKEAKSTGLLQHPGTVPVHDFGTLPDGRLYFTMQEIQGITLKDAIHRTSERHTIRLGHDTHQ